MEIKFPGKRLPALGKDDGRVLHEIEQRAGVKIAVVETGAEANLDVEPTQEGEGGGAWVAEQVLKAIGLGFEPKQAYLLFNDDYYIEVIDLELFFNRDAKLIERYKARVIGEDGRAKKVLQELSGAWMSVWENQIAILGQYDELRECRDAVKKLLEGATHAGVYAFLEKRKREKAMSDKGLL